MKLFKYILSIGLFILAANLQGQQISYLWSTGDTTANFQANPTQDTWYTVTVTQYGVSYVDSVWVKVNPTYLTQVSATICDNENYSFNGNSYSQTGVYFDTLQSASSCDSVIETTIHVNPTYLTQVSATICDNENYSFNGNSYTQAGVYFDTLQSVSSCDSVIETTIQVNPTYLTQVSATICDNESYSFNGNSYTQAGVYFDTLQSVSSCDSVIETSLTVNPTYLTQVSATICDNESYSFNGNSYTQAGVYFDTLQSILSCDSVIETTLQVNPIYLTQVSATICDNESYSFNGNSYTQAGVYYDTLQSASSCDSVIETSLTVNPIYLTQVSATICDNESYNFNGNSYSQAGVYYDTLQSVLSCDSVIETSLTVNPIYLTQVSATICDNESYSFNGNSYTQAGVYYDTLQSASSCDSVIETSLTVYPTYLTQVSVSICNNESYSFNGNSYTQAGLYYDTLQSVSSCDSVIETTLQVNPIYLTQVSTTICDNESYSFNGNSYSQAGVYFDTLQSASSCDSVIEINLSVNPTYLTQQNATICGNKSFAFNGNTYNKTGIYFDTLQSSLGCDSVIETNLVVNPFYFYNRKDTLCQGDSLMLPNGTFVNQQGVYTTAFNTQKGCDSIYITQLIVLPSYTIPDTINACNGQTVTLPDGNAVSQAGTYTSNLISQRGCDSIITTHVNFFPNYNDTIDAVICDGDLFQLPDFSWVSLAGTYTFNFPSKKGCDSIIVVELSVNTQVSFGPITGTANPVRNKPYKYSIDSFPDLKYLWSVSGGFISGSSNQSSAWVTWTDSLSGFVDVNIKDSNNACTYLNLMFVDIKEASTSTETINIQNFDFGLFPNPNKGEFEITLSRKISKPLQAQVFTLQGAKVASLEIPANTKTSSISLELAQGSYLLRLVTRDAALVKSFVVR